MSKFRMLVALVGAICAMAVAANAASASSITVSPAGAFTATSAQNLTLGSGSIAIACNLTFGGSLNASDTITSPLTAIGSITSATGGSCTNTGSVSFPSPVNWTIGYTGLDSSGAAQVTILGVNTTISVLGGLVRCTYAGNAAGSLNTTGSGSTATQIRFASSLALSSGGALCPNPGALTGFVTLSTPQTVTLVP